MHVVGLDPFIFIPFYPTERKSPTGKYRQGFLDFHIASKSCLATIWMKPIKLMTPMPKRTTIGGFGNGLGCYTNKKVDCPTIRAVST